MDSIDSPSALTSDDLTSIRRQLLEGQGLIRETVDKLRQSQEETEMTTRRKEELEARITQLEAEYEELLGKIYEIPRTSCSTINQKKQYTTKKLSIPILQSL